MCQVLPFLKHENSRWCRQCCPVMSGHEATIELRKQHCKEDLPIVALTAAALASEQEQSLAIGMNDFISKPFDAERLRSVLLQVTAHRRRAAEQS